MMADKSQRAILVCAILVMSTIALGTPTALAANAEKAPPIHEGPWPIRNGHNYQPTEHELRALHQKDVTPDQARDRPIVRSTPGEQRKSSQSIFCTLTLIAVSAKRPNLSL